MTVRELIMALAEVEAEIRRLRRVSALHDVENEAERTAAESEVAARLLELVVNEQLIVDELRSRHGLGQTGAESSGA